MSRILAALLLVVFMLTSTVGFTVHAAEPVGCLDAVTAVELGHTQGDLDQSPSDTGKDSHHHACCQGHQFAEPAKQAATYPPDVRASTFASAETVTLDSVGQDTAYRPPIS